MAGQKAGDGPIDSHQMQDLLRTVIEHSRSAIAVHDRDLRYLYVSQRYLNEYQIHDPDIIGKHHYEVFPDLPQKWRDVHQLALQGVVSRAEDDPYERSDGTMDWTRWECRPWYEPDGTIGGIIVYTEIITERKKAEEALRQSELKYRSYIDHAPDGIIVSDETGRFVEVNKAAAAITGYTMDQLLQTSLFDFLPRESREADLIHFQHLLERGSMSTTLQYCHRNGSMRWLSIEATRISQTRYLGFIKDITDKKQAEEDLVYLSYHDQLTGVYNRRFFEEELRRLDTSRNWPLSVIMGDINGLKLINDSFGHAVGDQLLQLAASVIKGGCRSDDIVARLGGDEFVIILPRTDSADAQRVISRLRSLAAREQVANVTLSISFGHETRLNDDLPMSAVLANAENQMYRNKLYEHNSVKSKTIDIIMNALFEKSSRESMHSRRVSELCQIIAAGMGFSQDEISKIVTAGLVHDIGKIGIPEEILNNAKHLSPSEWEEMKKHPETGWRILNAIDEFSELAAFVFEHQERWDGLGYPRGLKGDEISVQARIIAIADAYDAMTSERKYRKKLNPEEAIEEIRRCSGKQFDPQIASVLVDHIQSAQRTTGQ